MRRELSPTPAEREQRRLWSTSDFPSVAEVERWLETYSVRNKHPEANPEGGMYLHSGYEAFTCRRCGLPSIRGAGRRNATTCGRWACG